MKHKILLSWGERKKVHSILLRAPILSQNNSPTYRTNFSLLLAQIQTALRNLSDGCLSASSMWKCIYIFGENPRRQKIQLLSTSSEGMNRAGIYSSILWKSSIEYITPISTLGGRREVGKLSSIFSYKVERMCVKTTSVRWEEYAGLFGALLKFRPGSAPKSGPPPLRSVPSAGRTPAGAGGGGAEGAPERFSLRARSSHNPLAGDQDLTLRE